MNPKFCKDCRHYLPGMSPIFAKCARTKAEKLNLVTGETDIKYSYCDTQRELTNAGVTCGATGDFWEAKP